MRDELTRLNLNGRASDTAFANNPLPVVQAMGIALADFHASSIETGDRPRTADEVAAALTRIRAGDVPEPFSRVRATTLEAELETGPPTRPEPVRTHGAPVVDAAVLDRSVVTFDDAGSVGVDAAERDLAIALRSIAETFTAEVTPAFLDAYEHAGGRVPDPRTLDWYNLVAAFR